MTLKYDPLDGNILEYPTVTNLTAAHTVVEGGNIWPSTSNTLAVHGWTLWFVWALLGLLEMASSRYLRLYP